jgi:ribose transport system substrate-binding protein
MTRSALCAIGVLVVALGLTACGGDSSSSSTGSSSETGGGTSSAKEAAEKAASEITQYYKPPTSIGVDVPLKKAPIKDQTIAVLTCSLGVCQQIPDSAKEAAEFLDWKIEPFLFKPEPEATLTQMKAAVASEPDAIFVNGQERSTLSVGLDEAESAGIPVVNQATSETSVAPPIVAAPTGGETWKRMAGIIGKWITAETEGEANMLSYGLSSIRTSLVIAEDITEETEAACPTCTAKTIGASATDIGTKLPQQVVSEVQRNPDVNIICFSDGVMTSGVAAALRAAGLSDQVKIVMGNPSSEDIALIEKGEEYGGVAFSAIYYTWQGMDALVRYLNGEEQVKYEFPHQILTKESINGESQEAVRLLTPRDIQQQFEELWAAGK